MAPEPPLARESAQVGFRFVAAARRLEEPMPPVERFHRQSCPDDEIRLDSPSPKSRVLTLGLHDSRYGAKSLMPIRMTRWLGTKHDRVLEPFLEPSKEHDGEVLGRLLLSREALVNATSEVEALESRDYKGVFHVTQFKKAHLVRKKGERRRKWLPGVLQAWLVVYDIDESEPLCQVQLTVTNDVTDEPIWLRLKAETQRRLVEELGKSLRQEGEEQLSSISGALSFPQQATRLAVASPRPVSP